MNAGDSLYIDGLTIIAHDGWHHVPLRQFEIITPEGLRFLHTGDNEYVATLPDVTDVDVMMLNAWVDIYGSIIKINPKVTLPGHILELGHWESVLPPTTYQSALMDDGLFSYGYFVLSYGERYHFDNQSNDSIRPIDPEYFTYSICADTVTVSWRIPVKAEDGDTASFYRLIIDNKEDIITTSQHYCFMWNTEQINNLRIYSYDDCGNQSINFAEIDLSDVFVCNELIKIPESFNLLQNYPNPFNPSTTIRFNLPRSGFVCLRIYNLLGKEIDTLVNEQREAGEYTVEWIPEDLTSGIYLYRLRAGEYVETRKMVLQR
jgi:hypothetical protein